MKTEVEKGEGHEVILRVEAGPEDLTEILDQTYKDLGHQMKVPGFRKGKVPKQVIDSHLGADYVRAEAVKNGLPTLYVMAVMESGIMPVSDPDINLLEAGEEGRVVFEAKVDVKPEVVVEDYKGLELKAPDTEVTDEDVQQALDEARDRFATLEVVEARPAEKGDYVMFDFKVFADGVPLEGKSGTDRMSEIGAGDFVPGFDEQLIGARKGDILDVIINFPDDYGEPELAGKPATFRTIVKEIKRKVLPPIDDDLAKEVSHFDTLDEFREDLRSRIVNVKKSMGQRQLKEEVVKVLVEQTYIDLPESMVEHQVNGEIEELTEELAQRNITLEDYLQALKGTVGELEKAIREKVVDSLKAELILDAVASAEGIEVSDEEAEDYIRENALAAGADPKKVIAEARKHNRIGNVKANLRLSKAVDLLVENAVLEDGEPPEGVLLEPAAAETVETEEAQAAPADETAAEGGIAPGEAAEKETEETAGEAAEAVAESTREEPEEL
ncbi:MAG: trigger factor [Candidatus Geothermincolia bacterium]